MYRTRFLAFPLACYLGLLPFNSSTALAGVTERVSLSSSGEQGNSGSLYACISADGRYVAFSSDAYNLVPGDTNNAEDIFVRDRQTGQTTRVSVATGGAQGDGGSYYPSISADGRFVAFCSDAYNLVPGDTNNAEDIFVRDRQTGATECVSVATGGAQGNYDSELPSISADGRFVAFCSYADNLVPGDANTAEDVFVRDCVTGQTSRVSVSSSGGQGNGYSSSASISVDGRFIAFLSGASNLVSGDTNGEDDVFVHDCVTGQTSRVSVSSSGTQGDSDSSSPSISADGRYVAFDSYGLSVASADSSISPTSILSPDTFIHDRQTRETVMVAVAGGGPSVSGDGRYVAFESAASDLVPGDTNGYADVFVRDRWGGGYLYRNDLRVAGCSDVSRARPGQEVTFTCYYANAGSTPLLSATLTSSVPSLYCSFVSATGGGTFNAADRSVSWNISKIPPRGANQTQSFTVLVDPNAPGTLLSTMFALSTDNLPQLYSNTVSVEVSDPAGQLIAALQALRDAIKNAIWIDDGSWSYCSLQAEMQDQFHQYRNDMLVDYLAQSFLGAIPAVTLPVSGMTGFVAQQRNGLSAMLALTNAAATCTGYASDVVDLATFADNFANACQTTRNGGKQAVIDALYSGNLMAVAPPDSQRDIRHNIVQVFSDVDARTNATVAALQAGGVPANLNVDALIKELASMQRKVNRSRVMEVNIGIPGTSDQATVGAITGDLPAMYAAISSAYSAQYSRFLSVAVDLGSSLAKVALTFGTGGGSAACELAINAFGVGKAAFEGTYSAFSLALHVTPEQTAMGILYASFANLQTDTGALERLYFEELNRVDSLVTTGLASRASSSAGAVEIESVSFPSSVLPFVQYEAGNAQQTGTVNIVNGGGAPLDARMSVEFHTSDCPAPIGILAGLPVTIPAETSAPTTIHYSLPPISTYGPKALAYRAYVKLSANGVDTDTWSEPFVVASTQAELDLLGATTRTTVLSGVLPRYVTEESSFTCGENTNMVEFVLSHKAGDVDLHVFDSTGNEVGYDPDVGITRTNIPGSRYSGNGTNPETIVVPASHGQTFRVLAYCVDADAPTDYTVIAHEFPTRPAVLDSCIGSVRLKYAGALSDSAVFSFAEIGGQIGVNGLTVQASDLSGPDDRVIPASDVAIATPPGSLAPASGAEVLVTVTVGMDTLPGTYQGVVTISGQDAATGQAVSAQTPLYVEIVGFGVGYAKANANGVSVGIPSAVITSGTESFGDRFYIEEENRTSGLLVICGAGKTYETGRRVSIVGPITTTQDSERAIANPTIGTFEVTTVPRPLGMSNKRLGSGAYGGYTQGVAGGSGLNNIGLLVRVWGNVTQIGPDYLYINDGSNVEDGSNTGTDANIGIRVICDPTGYKSGDFLIVSGISSCFKTSSGNIARRILTREPGDVQNVSGQ